jgi:hypothetical protein
MRCRVHYVSTMDGVDVLLSIVGIDFVAGNFIGYRVAILVEEFHGLPVPIRDGCRVFFG